MPATATQQLVDDVVDLQAQYGRDDGSIGGTTPDDGVVDVWNAAPPVDPITGLILWRQVIAVRVGVLVRSQNYEKPIPPAGCASDDRRADLGGRPVDRARRDAELLQAPRLRDGDSPAQHDLEAGMRARTRLAARRERGTILFVALIVLVAMSLAGIALMRSVDTNVSSPATWRSARARPRAPTMASSPPAPCLAAMGRI